MQLVKLSDERPPPYIKFLAHNEKTGEYFYNYLIFSPFNKFYSAEKVFTHWIKNEHHKNAEYVKLKK